METLPIEPILRAGTIQAASQCYKVSVLQPSVTSFVSAQEVVSAHQFPSPVPDRCSCQVLRDP